MVDTISSGKRDSSGNSGMNDGLDFRKTIPAQKAVLNLETGVQTASRIVTYCKACLEPIRSGATICPNCRSRQTKHSWWENTVTASKWIGGISAILSLAALCIQLTEVLQNLNDSRKTVADLNRSAEMMISMEDFSGGMNLTRQALKISPGNQKARLLQSVAASNIVRSRTKPLPEKEWLSEIEPLIQIMRQRIGGMNPRESADTLAHIGWAHFLGGERHFDNLGISLRKALSLDQDNVYANTFLAAWCATSAKGSVPTPKECWDHPGASAVSLYHTAFKQNRDRNCVQQMVYGATRTSGRNRNPAGIAFANTLRKEGLTVDPKYQWKIFQILHHMMSFGRIDKELIEMVSPEDIFQTMADLNPDPDDAHYLDDVIKAELLGFYDDKIEAMNRLKYLRMRVRRETKDIHWGSETESPVLYVDRLILKLSDVRLGRIDFKFKEKLNEEAVENLPPSIRHGAVVTEVIPSGAADSAGLKVGDVIVAINKNLLRGDSHVPLTFAPMLAGEQVALTLLRAGIEKRVILSLQDGRTDASGELGDTVFLNRVVNRLFHQFVEIDIDNGSYLLVADLNETLRKGYAIEDGLQGVIILERKQGLRPGEMLMKLNNQKIIHAEDVRTAINNAVGQANEKARTVRISAEVMGTKGPVRTENLKIYVN